jgi:hypothetical protein
MTRLEAVYMDYGKAMRSWLPAQSANTAAPLSRPTFGKMVSRAFPGIRTQRFGADCRYYLGLRRVCNSGDGGGDGAQDQPQRSTSPLLSWVELMIPPM